MVKAKAVIGLVAEASTERNARMIARTRLEELYSWSSAVDTPYAVEELHNMRIATKRLRYTLEVFENVLPPSSKEMLKELVQIQEELGQIHDSDVLIALLRLCLGSQESPIDERALMTRGKKKKQRKSALDSKMLAQLLDPDEAPSASERYGLEQLLRKEQDLRERYYTAFRQHWYKLQTRDFRRQVLTMLEE